MEITLFKSNSDFLFSFFEIHPKKSIISLFEKGKMWEEAIKCCKELEDEYEYNLIDFEHLSTYLKVKILPSISFLRNI